jgi:hypothetical protein
MNSKIGLLGVVAVLQLLLIIVLTLAPTSSTSDGENLLSLQPEDVTSFVISDGTTEVEVTKKTDGWQVAGVSADADKVTNTLDKLAQVAATWPVATSSASAERFEVGDENFQRRLRLMGGDVQLVELYLGTSPGYQRVHARRSDSDDVYSVELSNYELAVNTDGWVDKGLLAATGTPSSITVDFVSEDEPRQEVLVRSEEGWIHNGGAADQDAARTYANRYTTLRVLGLASDSGEETAVAVVTLIDGETSIKLSIGKVAEQEDYVITPQSGGKYRLATYIAEQLLMTDADFSVKEEFTEPAVEGVGDS